MSRSNRHVARRWGLILAAVISIGAVPSFAKTDTETGTAGTNGTNGANGNGGTSGTNGGTANANATATDAVNTAKATGGTGGTGGNGGNATGEFTAGGAAGNGGGGGFAEATAGQSSGSPANPSDTATAIGGNGGNGGNGGGAVRGARGAGGVGGAGGDAEVLSVTASGTGNVIASGTATGGNGGSGGSGTGSPNGGLGGLAEVGQTTVTSTANATATVSEFGGNGGSANSAFIGGNGATVSFNNDVTVKAPGSVDVFQSDSGGIGGSSQGGVAGIGGGATNTLTFNPSETPSSFQGETSAIGGDGGSNQGGNGAVGGATVSDLTATGAFPMSLFSWCNNETTDQAGFGGDVTSGTGNGGAGGSAVASVGGFNSGGNGLGQVTSQVVSYAGYGGAVSSTATGSGGVGGAATILTSTLTNVSSDTLSFAGYVTSGNGGSGSGASFSGGNGGAVSVGTITGLSAGGGNVILSLSATGGDGGYGFGAASGGNGASVNLLNNLSPNSSGGYISVEQDALGGNAGGSDSGPGGTGGNAISSLTISTTNSGEIQGTITTYGGNSGKGSAALVNGGSASSYLSLTRPGIVTANVNVNIVLFSSNPPTQGGNGGECDTGTAGAGGSASGFASANDTATSGNSFANAQAFILGGTGGLGFFGGVGGTATGGVHASDDTSGSVSASATVVGGTGGGSNFTGGQAGAGGQAIITPSSVSSATGFVDLSVTADGGAGGQGLASATGGAGANVTLTNAVSGSTSNSLNIGQIANGGGGGGSDYGTPGVGGNAVSSLTLLVSGTSSSAIDSSAAGGDAGTSEGTAGAIGGSGASSVSVVGNSDLNCNSLATGGLGSDGYVAAPGGAATAISSATNSNSVSGMGSATAIASSTGGTGGFVTNLGDNTSPQGNGGIGGAAFASATATGQGSDPVLAIASALGGSGGGAAGNGFVNGNGGNATAFAIATSSAGPATATANVTAGLAGVLNSGVLLGSPGNAFGSAAASGINSAQADVHGYNGANGSATALATATNVFFYDVTGTSITPIDQQANAESIANIGKPFSVSTGFQSGTDVTASPQSADVTSRWNTHVKNALQNSASNVNVLTAVDLQDFSGGSTASHVYSSIVDIDQSHFLTSSNALIVGLLNSASLSSGLGIGDSLRFRVERAGTTAIDQTFTSNNALQSYFDDSVIFLGPENAEGPPTLDVQFLFDLTTTHPGAGVTFQLALGNANDTELGVWQFPFSGSWATPTDWSANTLPDGPGVQALFGSAISAPQTVTLDENTIAGSLEFNNTNSYTIASGAGGFSLTLDNAGTAAAITVLSGNHVISAPVVLTSFGLNTFVPSGQTLTLSGTITGPAPLNLSETGTVMLGKNTGQVDLTGLTIATGGRLDVNDNPIILTYTGTSPIATIRSYLTSGYNGGAWNGPGIASSAIANSNATQSALIYSIGYADGADGVVNGLSSGEIEILPTLAGDAKLQGNVNFGDFQLLAANFGSSAGWDGGNFTYSSVVNFGDFQLLAQNFGANSSALTSSELASLNNFAAPFGEELIANPTGEGYVMVSVPEPSTPILLALASPVIVARRCRRPTRRLLPTTP